MDDVLDRVSDADLIEHEVDEPLISTKVKCK